MSDETRMIPIQEIDHHYVNGFQLNLSNSDVNGIFTLNGVPEFVMTMSFTSAKTLANSLQDLIKTLESVTERSLMTIDEVNSGIQKIAKNTN